MILVAYQLLTYVYFVAGSITKKLGIKVQADSSSVDLFRGIRSQLAALLDGLDPKDLAQMSLGLSHSLSRYVYLFLRVLEAELTLGLV